MDQQKEEVTIGSLINNMISGIELAQKRGAYSLQESTALYTTILKLKEVIETPKEETQEKPQEEKKNTMII
jgi:hypothetical protein